MPRTVMIYPLVGCFLGYAGGVLTGVEDSLLLFGITILTMIAVTVAGFYFTRRSGK